MKTNPNIRIVHHTVGAIPIFGGAPTAAPIVPAPRPNKVRLLADAYRASIWHRREPHKFYDGSRIDLGCDLEPGGYEFVSRSRGGIPKLKNDSFAKVRNSWISARGTLATEGGSLTHGMTGHTSTFGNNDFTLLLPVGTERLFTIKFSLHNYSSPVALTTDFDFAPLEFFRPLKSELEADVEEVLIVDGKTGFHHIGRITLNELIFPWKRGSGKITVNDQYGINSPGYRGDMDYSATRPVMEYVCGSLLSGEIFSNLRDWK